MQQRQLRLGDILDDYCPRERRVTNHAIVAIVGQEVRQTRCVTCEAEHEYKQARVPPQRRKAPAPGALYQDVLGGMPKPVPPVPRPAQVEDEPDEIQPDPPATAEAAAVQASTSEENEGPVHRPLIRATLPRPEGQTPARPIPDFTVRQPTARPGRFRPNGKPRRGGGHHAQGFSGPGPGFGGRRGPGAAQTARPGHGNRARPGPTDRQGPPRRRGGKKRTK
jgi:hypothetical protein